MAGLADLQHEAGYLGDGLEEVALLGVVVEHAVEGLTELDELVLWRETKKTCAIQRRLVVIARHCNCVQYYKMLFFILGCKPRVSPPQ